MFYFKFSEFKLIPAGFPLSEFYRRLPWLIIYLLLEITELE